MLLSLKKNPISFYRNASLVAVQSFTDSTISRPYEPNDPLFRVCCHCFKKAKLKEWKSKSANECCTFSSYLVVLYTRSVSSWQFLQMGTTQIFMTADGHLFQLNAARVGVSKCTRDTRFTWSGFNRKDMYGRLFRSRPSFNIYLYTNSELISELTLNFHVTLQLRCLWHNPMKPKLVSFGLCESCIKCAYN